jgi:DNA-binding NtrC family response regulator
MKSRKGYIASFSVSQSFEIDKERRSSRELMVEEEDMNKILIVDEGAAIRMLYQEELAEEGYDVDTTDGYDELLEIIEEKEPDLVVLDVKRNGSNRLNLLQDIRTSFRDLPIILCTTHDALKYGAKIAAANYFLIKSSDLRRLKRMVRLAMEVREQRSAEKRTLPFGQDRIPTISIHSS